jgi:uncharacterized damage-inducible protein DinB
MYWLHRERDGDSPELELLKEWYRYNSFVRKKYLDTIFEKVPEQERYKERGASFSSIVDIFVHVVDAYRIWFIYAFEDKFSEYQNLRGSKNYSKAEVEDEERKIDSYVQNFLNELSEDDLVRYFVFKWDEKQFQRTKIRDMLWHLVEEELQHRGELNALLWQLDIDPPITGWNPWDEEKESITREEYLKAKKNGEINHKGSKN